MTEDSHERVADDGRTSEGFHFDLTLSFREEDRAIADDLNSALEDRGLRVRLQGRFGGVDVSDSVLVTDAHVRESEQLVCLCGPGGPSETQRRLLLDVELQRLYGKSHLVIQVFRDVRETFALDARSIWLNLNVLSVGGVAQSISDLKGVSRVSSARSILDKGQYSPSCPYIGFRAFSEDDAVFLGRELEAQYLMERLQAYPAVVVVSASGVGKTSLVRAGLIPALRASAPDITWYIVAMRPGVSPWRALGSALGSLGHLNGSDALRHLQQKTDGSPTSRCRDGARAVEAIVDQLRDRSSRPCKILLFLDCWEEVYHGNTSDSQAFLDALLEAARDNADIKVALTLDANWWGHFLATAPDTELLPDASIMHLRPFGRNAIRQVVEESAREAGLSLDRALLDRLSSEVSHLPETLPLLQLTLRDLWRASQAAGVPTLTLADYERLGGVAEALDRRMLDVRERLDRAERMELAALLVGQPARIAEQSGLTQDIAFHALSKTQRNLVWMLLDEGLLEIIDLHGEGNIGVRVAHESLLEHSPLVQKWISTCREALITWSKLESDAALPLKDGGERPAGQPPLSHEQAREIRNRLQDLPPCYELSQQALQFLGPVDSNSLLAEIADKQTTHRRRRFLGERLSVIGDSRAGVDCREGIPEIDWLEVSGKQVMIEARRRRLPGRKRVFRRVAGFKIARYLVTVGQYRAFLEADNGWNDPRWWHQDLLRDPEGNQIDAGSYSNHPVQHVNWFDAVAFCRWLTETLHQSGRLGAKSVVRLPNEWEWQHAATGGNSENHYPWGSLWKTADSRHCANTFESQLGGTTAVGIYPDGASSTGALDMAGNVFEWCLNQYNAPFREASAIQDLDQRAVRGGSWFTPKTEARCLNRRFDQPEDRFVDVGFRVVCTLPNETDAAKGDVNLGRKLMG